MTSELQRDIASARAVHPIAEKVINTCRLKVGENYRQWLDESANTIKLEDDVVTISTTKGLVNSTDIFAKSNPKNYLLRVSYWVYYIQSRDRAILAAMGNDGIIRCSYYVSGQWEKNLVPLQLGWDCLKFICENYLEDELEVKGHQVPKLLSSAAGFCGSLPLKPEWFKRLPEEIVKSG